MAKAKKTAADDKVLRSYETALPVKLTEEEFHVRAEQMAQTKLELEEHQAHASTVKEELRATKAAIEEKLAALAGVIRDGAEERQVMVNVVADFDRNTASHVRTDTLEVMETKALEEHERQAMLFESVPPPRATNGARDLAEGQPV